MKNAPVNGIIQRNTAIKVNVNAFGTPKMNKPRPARRPWIIPTIIKP